MRHFMLLAALCIPAAGCHGAAKDGSKETKDAAPIYAAVLKEELKDTKQGEGLYVFVDGKDPSPDFLDRFREQWPELQPGSKAPKGKAKRVSVDSLQWIDSDTAELHGATSNGIDGRSSLYRVVRKGGVWVVDNVKLKAVS